MRVGIIVGAFDLLHAGHIHLLKQCKKRCDYLIVGLHANPSIERPSKNKPIESLLERQIKLYACKYVDEVAVYETEADLSIIFKYFKIDVRFLGSDYAEATDYKPVTEPEAIPIEHIDSLPIHSSDIRRRMNDNN